MKGRYIAVVEIQGVKKEILRFLKEELEKYTKENEKEDLNIEIDNIDYGDRYGDKYEVFNYTMIKLDPDCEAQIRIRGLDKVILRKETKLYAEIIGHDDENLETFIYRSVKLDVQSRKRFKVKDFIEFSKGNKGLWFTVSTVYKKNGFYYSHKFKVTNGVLIGEKIRTFDSRLDSQLCEI